MAMRLSGLMSGMDTESVIQQLVEARRTKVTKAKNEQTKLEWKQEAWKGLNTKLKNLQAKLNDLRFTGGYAKKATKVSDSSIASVLTSGSAANGVQTLKVNQIAKTAYLTGGKVEMKAGVTGEVTALTRMDFLMNFDKDANGVEKAKHLSVQKADGSQVDIQLTSSTTISDVLTQLQDAGLNASFDAGQKRFFVNSKEAGADANFMITGDTNALRSLGLYSNRVGGELQRIDNSSLKVAVNTSLGCLMSFPGGVSRLFDIVDAEGNKIESIGISSEDTIDDVLKRIKQFTGMEGRFDEREQKFYF